MEQNEIIKALKKEKKTALHENKEAFDIAIAKIQKDYITNSELIKALFPELQLSATDGKVFVRNPGEEFAVMCFSWMWWNLPYRKEQ